MKKETISRKHWQGDKVSYTFDLAETMDEASEIHTPEEVIYAYQQGVRVISGVRLQAVCRESTGGIRSTPSMDLNEVLAWLAQGISLTPTRSSKSEDLKYAEHLVSLPPEERQEKVMELQAMVKTMLAEEG